MPASPPVVPTRTQPTRRRFPKWTNGTGWLLHSDAIGGSGYYTFKPTSAASVNYDLDVYASVSGVKRPVVLLWYGHGFTTGSSKSLNATAAGIAALLAQMGFVVVVPDYPNVPATSGNTDTSYIGGAIGAGAAAMTWVRANAATYGGDPTRVCEWGMSSGGMLAMVSALAGVAGTTRPECVVLWSGCFDPLDTDCGAGNPSGLHACNYMGGSSGAQPSNYSTYSMWVQTPLVTGMVPVRSMDGTNEQNGGATVILNNVPQFATLLTNAGITHVCTQFASNVHADWRIDDLADAASWVLDTMGVHGLAT